MNNILEVRNLCKKYGMFSLDNVSFELPGGYIMGFIGPNGAGKTTTIKLILDVARRDAGLIKLFGLESGVSEQIGVVVDAPLYVDDWMVSDVESALAPFYGQWDRQAFRDYLKKFNLDPKKKIKELSHGMKIKLQISAALSHNAKLLILDEPTSGLDPVARDEIADLLRAFVSDDSKGVLFSTHITSDLENTADYITFILNGKIVYTGEKDELLEKYVRVAGGYDEIDAGQRDLIIGYRNYGEGFEGMAEMSDIGKLPRSLLMEKITLDEIIIFMNKGGSINE